MRQQGIAIIGRVANSVELLDGQTVKTKILCEELQQNFPERKIICVDTYQYRKNMFSILFNTIQAFWSCEHIFVLLSRNGRTFFFPIITGLNKLFHRKLYHDVVGGALPIEAKERPKLRKQLQRFEVNWVEFATMKESLAEIGVSNVEVLPNFKRLNILSITELKNAYTEPFVFVMFSRVVKEKGMGEAAEAIRIVNSQFGRERAVLHIYGPVDEGYKSEFEQLLVKYQGEVYYKGCVAFDESVLVLRSSYMLLFPSTYKGEGMPGTIIDAYSSGLPVIATDWNYNAELVHNGETGYCYEWQKPELLAHHIAYAIEHPVEINQMRSNCLIEAAKYTPDAAMGQIRRRMNE